MALLAFGVGVAGAFDIPIRQSFLQDLVGRDDLPNAIALNSLAFNGARLVGPAIGGFVLAACGEAAVFLVNGLTYLAVLGGLLAMRVDPAPPARRSGGWIGEILQGPALGRANAPRPRLPRADGDHRASSRSPTRSCCRSSPGTCSHVGSTRARPDDGRHRPGSDDRRAGDRDPPGTRARRVAPWRWR